MRLLFPRVHSSPRKKKRKTFIRPLELLSDTSRFHTGIVFGIYAHIYEACIRYRLDVRDLAHLLWAHLYTATDFFFFNPLCSSNPPLS